MDFTLRQMRALVAVARLGSFTRAASAVHVSQPALTVQIRQLEEALGARLLDRTTRSVALTPIGREFVPIFERILHEIDGVTADVQALTSRRRGTVAVAALPSIAAGFLPSCIAAFRAQHPGIAVRLRDAVAQRVVALVKDGDVDFGIASAQPDREVTLTPLITDRMSVVFPPGHPLGRKKRILLADLSRVPLIVTDTESSVRALVDRAFASIGRSPLVAYEATFMATAIGLVKAGLGVAILPSSTALESGPLSGLEVRSIGHTGLIRRISVVQRAGRSLSPAADHFVKAIHGACQTVRF